MGCQQSVAVTLEDGDGANKDFTVVELTTTRKKSQETTALLDHGYQNDDLSMDNKAAASDTTFENDYRIIRHIGGSVSSIYLVEKKLSKTVPQNEDLEVYVMQVIDMKAVAPERRIAMQEEILALKNISHPNILKVWDVYNNIQRNNTISMVTEVCTGLDLSAYASKPCSEDKARFIVVQILIALKYMHHNGYYNHNLSLENIMFKDDNNETIKITYAGLSSNTAMNCVTDFLSGSISKGEKDIQSIGSITYQLLSGGREPPTSVDNFCDDNDITNQQQSNYNGTFQHSENLFMGGIWRKIPLSGAAKEFVKKCMPVGFRTVDQALQHRWITESSIYMQGTQPLVGEVKEISHIDVDIDSLSLPCLTVAAEVDPVVLSDAQGNTATNFESAAVNPLLNERIQVDLELPLLDLSEDPSLSTMKYDILVKTCSDEKDESHNTTLPVYAPTEMAIFEEQITKASTGESISTPLPYCELVQENNPTFTQVSIVQDNNLSDESKVLDIVPSPHPLNHELSNLTNSDTLEISESSIEVIDAIDPSNEFEASGATLKILTENEILTEVPAPMLGPIHDDSPSVSRESPQKNVVECVGTTEREPPRVPESSLDKCESRFSSTIVSMNLPVQTVQILDGNETSEDESIGVREPPVEIIDESDSSDERSVGVQRPLIGIANDVSESSDDGSVGVPYPTLPPNDVPSPKSPRYIPPTPVSPESPSQTPMDFKDLRDVFQEVNQGGNVTAEVLRERLRSKYTEDEVNNWFKSGKFDDQRNVKYKDFLAEAIRSRRKIERLRVEEAFQKIDKGKHGFVTVGNLRAVLGTDNSEYIEQLIKEANSKRDNRITYEKFKEVLKKYNRYEI